MFTLGVPGLMSFSFHCQLYLLQPKLMVYLINTLHKLETLWSVLHFIKEVLLNDRRICDIAKDYSRLLIENAFPINGFKNRQGCLGYLNRVGGGNGKDSCLTIAILWQVFSKAIAHDIDGDSTCYRMLPT